MSPRQLHNGRKFGESGRVIHDTLHEYGVIGAIFSKTKHAYVDFIINGRALRFRFACSPRSEGTAAKDCRRRLVALIEGTAR